MCDWDAGGHEETEEYYLPRIPATHPHPKTLPMCLWWSGRSEALGMGRKSEGAKYPPFGASSPADPHRHPYLPQICPGRGAQAHPDQGPWQPGAAHQTPQQRKNYPTPSFSQLPDYKRQ